MKPGVSVAYTAADGGVALASVVAVVGAGESGFKILDLYANGEVIGSVVHAQDSTGGGHWMLPDVTSAGDAAGDAPAVSDLDLPVWQPGFETESPDL